MAVDERQESILIRKARRKFISNSLTAKLVSIGGDVWQPQYRKTFSCCHVLEADHEDIRSMFYCKKRWCQTCQAISMATQINNYQSIFEEFMKEDDLYFVTLTRRTVEAKELNNRIDEMQLSWRKITDLARKKCENFKGLRKIECKISSGTKQYHAHYHVLIVGKSNAEFLIDNWLRLNPTDSSRKAQDMRIVDNSEAALKEVFKYTVKLTTGQKDNEIPMSPKQLDKIFKTLYKKRVYQSFGGVRKCNDEDFVIERANLKAAAGYYYWCGNDWYHEDYGHALTGYNPTANDMVYL